MTAPEKDRHLIVVARIIRSCADSIGMNEPRYADRLLALADMADSEARGGFMLCSAPGCPGDARYAPPGRGHYDHGPIIPSERSEE